MALAEKYKNAKQQGLNWQALLIEETQTEIKSIIQKMVLARKTFLEINKAIVKKVEQTVNELESKKLKEISAYALLMFATRVYYFLEQTYKNISLVGLVAMSSVANGTATSKQVAIARKTIQGLPNVSPSAYNTATALNTYCKDYMKKVSERIDKLATFEAKEDYRSRANLRNIAEIQVRQEKHQQEIDNFINKGIQLVWIEPHANCSERCQPWQGKLYSLDGTYGSVDGNPYQPLKNATDIYETTKGGVTYKNGCISGFNCRHRLVAYHGNNKPVEVPKNVIDKMREVNDKQRYFERGIRKWKERAIYEKNQGNIKAYEEAKSRAKEWNKKYISFSEKNKVAYYPSRTDII